VRRRLRGLLVKVDVSPIVVDHFATLRDHARGRLSVGDWLLLVGGPAIGGGVVWGFEVRVAHPATVAGAVGVFAGLLFALLVLAFDMAVRAASTARTSGATADTRARAQVIGELGANVAYCVLVTLALSGLLVGVALAYPAADAGGATVAPPLSALISAVGLHLALTLLMVLKRVYRLIRHELRTAAVGGE
jgi:hypothetical protein